MSSRPTPSFAAQIAIAAMALLGLIGGWMIVLEGGFHHKPYRRSPDTIFVDGLSAMFVAAIFFTMAALAVAALLQARQSRPWGYWLGCGAVLLPPLLWALGA